jgi:LmbE family N-acetylglucosaminyl deacetylase
MDTIRRWLIRRLSRKAGPYLKARGLWQVNKHNPALIWEPGDERVLVLAPHMDDEVIGCGGTLHRHAQRGGEITVVYLTDGRYGGQIPPEAKSHKLTQVRRAEAQQALATLGIQNALFLNAEETQLANTPALSHLLREILTTLRPHLVYLPFFWEEHPDHQAANQLLLDAVARENLHFDCHAYEVWTPLFPNCLVEITSVVETKRQALQCYQSQLMENNYAHAILGLNAYRAIALSDSGMHFVEAFFMAPLVEYQELYRKHQWISAAESSRRPS